MRIDIKDRPGDGELSGEVIFPAPPLVLTLGLERATEPLLELRRRVADIEQQVKRLEARSQG